MTPQVVVSHRAAGLAPAARLLAHWWSRPEAEEVESWSDGWPLAADAAATLRAGAAEVEHLEAAVAEFEVEQLLDEYERVLVGPGRVACGPYESLWRGDGPRREQGRLMGAASADVVRIYRDLGISVRADARELPDHLAIEWEALAYAFEQDALEASAELARGHLAVWMPPFCEAVAAETESPFYAALARLTPLWTAALSG